jgi:hypothetical protein
VVAAPIPVVVVLRTVDMPILNKVTSTAEESTRGMAVVVTEVVSLMQPLRLAPALEEPQAVEAREATAVVAAVSRTRRVVAATVEARQIRARHHRAHQQELLATRGRSR